MVSRDRLVGSAALIAASLYAGGANAEVRLEGDWPSGDETVSLELSGVSRSQALRELAAEAGWSLILREGAEDRVDLTIKSQPATRVLDALLEEGDWVAKRSGSIVTISRSSGAAAPPPPPAPDAPDSPDSPERPKPEKQRDIEVWGKNLRIGKDDVVHDVTVMGGNVEIEGRVTGDLAVVGGKAHLLKGAHVEGDASATGGLIQIDEGARIDGDLGVVGGSIQGTENARVGGSVKLDPAEGEARASLAERAVHKVSEAIRTASFFFVVGALVIALGGARAESVRAEVAARPMRAAALGLLGILGAVLTIAIAAVTVVGIPVALVGALALIVAVFAGITSALTVLGAAVTRHKTSNVYLHLAAGCVLFLLAGLIPVVGGLAQAGVILAGIGGVVATRAGGLLDKKNGGAESSGLPYR
jgi:hypothetical protein